jgi:hypothetical protein
MESISHNLDGASWVKLVDDGDEYLLQNQSNDMLEIKVASSEPTNDVGSVKVGRYEVLSSTIVSGTIWGKSMLPTKKVRVSVVK